MGREEIGGSEERGRVQERDNVVGELAAGIAVGHCRGEGLVECPDPEPLVP